MQQPSPYILCNICMVSAFVSNGSNIGAKSRSCVSIQKPRNHHIIDRRFGVSDTI